MDTPANDDLAEQLSRLIALQMEMDNRIDELSGRMDNMVERLAALSQRIESLEQRPAPVPAPEEPPKPTPEKPRRIPISPRMIEIIKLVHMGEGERAQTELHNLPEEELASQPSIVALVAAALFIQRGDYSSAIRALNRARDLTDDPRILKVLELVEQQAK